MKIMHWIWVGIAVLMVLIGCNKDFDANAEWEDITVLYAILNQNDSVHTIKVSKAFLGDAAAADMAQEFDSLYYDTLNVTIEGYSGSQKLQTLTCTPVYNIPKDTGYFYAPEQVLYQSTGVLNSDLHYKIVIKNIQKNTEIAGETDLINGEGSNALRISKPTASFLETINFASQYPYKVKFKTGKNGFVYQLRIRFHYTENNIPKYIDWDFSNIFSSGIEGNEEIMVSIIGDNFYKYLGNNIEPANYGVERVPDSLDFIVYAAGEDLYTYLELNKPSTGLVQYRPEYTNVQNGKGLVSCRFDVRITGKRFSVAAIDELVKGPYTKELGFVYP